MRGCAGRRAIALPVSVTRPVPASTAPRRSSRARAAAICPAGGGSSHGSAAAGSASAAPPPHAARFSASGARSALAISGGVSAASEACVVSDHRR